MDKKTKKKFVKFALAGLIVGRVTPVVAAPFNIGSEVDAALQKARAEQRLPMQEVSAAGAVDIEEETVGLY